MPRRAAAPVRIRQAAAFGGLATLTIIGFGCGEGVVEFRGSVSEGDSTTYTVADVASVEGRPLVPDARVDVVVDVDDCGAGETVAADGSFRAETFFGGVVCEDKVALLCVTAPGFKPLRVALSVTSPEAADGRFMNVTLERLAGAP